MPTPTSRERGTNRSVDPLTRFIAVHRRALPANRRGGKRFNAGEHAWLASHGANLACDELAKKRGVPIDKDLFESIRRRDGRETLQYGELVALSGDFYETPEALFEETPSCLPWLWEDDDLSDLRDIFLEELQWIEARQQGQGSLTYPDENVRLAWNAKSYVELALRNTDHFGWHNLCTYVRHHTEALRLAASAQGREDETFRRALYVNAFADHFLTDGFAAGHIRVPRAEIRAWAGMRGLDEKVAGALSKLLHDQDGHVNTDSLHGVIDENHRSAEDGLWVQDSTGADWRTRCDGQLFLASDAAQSMAVERAVRAVAASVSELMLAWKRRELPTGIYAATELVPFPHPDGPTLVEKFPANLADGELERLWQGVAWYTKIPWLSGLERHHIRDLLAALPRLMADFRANVAADAGAHPDITARMAPRYVAAFKQIDVPRVPAVLGKVPQVPLLGIGTRGPAASAAAPSERAGARARPWKVRSEPESSRLNATDVMDDNGPVSVRASSSAHKAAVQADEDDGPVSGPASGVAHHAKPVQADEDDGPVNWRASGKIPKMTCQTDERRTVQAHGHPDDAPVVQRHLLGDLPATVTAGATVSLLVSLESVVSAGATASGPFSARVGATIDIVVKPIAGLTLVGSRDGTLAVEDPQSTLPLQFKLTAGPAGPGSVCVYAFCGGRPVANLRLATTIVEAQTVKAQTDANPGEQRAGTSVSILPLPPPDLSMYIFEDGNELSFKLQSADRSLNMQDFGPIRLTSSPRDHFRAFFRDIENLSLDTPQKRLVAKRRLEAKGSNLFDEIFPDDLKALLWDLRDRVQTIQISSEEPWIPWEVCRLQGKVDGHVVEGKFFAEAFNVTRWFCGVAVAPRLGLRNLALVVPGDSGLSQAVTEKGYVLSLGGPGRTITEVPATYLDVTNAMATGAYDAWHFTGHARADDNTDADQSAIELANREVLTPEDVTGKYKNVLLPRPFIFLNACQSAQGGLSLTGVGGWAQRFVKPGSADQAASAFVGSYWSVFDEAALGFAKALYQGLLAGKPIGQAAKEARLQIRDQNDPTWLAYTVYADPYATLA